MKKLLWIVAMATLIPTIESCSNNSNADAIAAEEDSVRRADSIAAVQLAAERARIDSLRQDSIQKQEAIEAAMPQAAWFISQNDDLKSVGELRKLLVAKGYEKINANKYVLNPDGTPSATIILDYKVIEGEYEPDIDEYVGGGYSYNIDIKLSDKIYADQFAATWKNGNWRQMTRNGKNIQLYSWGD